MGEGFSTTFAFYVADANRAPLQFHDAGKQLSTILKDLKPENCWEENYNIENIYGERVALNGKSYTRYKIYQATYYPLNLETVNFPSVPFEMIKYEYDHLLSSGEIDKKTLRHSTPKKNL